MPLAVRTLTAALATTVLVLAGPPATATATQAAEWIDPSYGAAGVALFAGEGDLTVSAMDDAGRVLLATSTGGADPQVRLHRLTADGAVDTSFAGGAVSLPRMPQVVHADAASTVTVADLPETGGGVRISRFTSTGQPDLPAVTLLPGVALDFVFAVMERADGSLIVAAYRQSFLPSAAYLIAVTRWGALDPSWAPDSPTPGVLRLDEQIVVDIAPDAGSVVALVLADLRSSIRRYTGSAAADPAFTPVVFEEGFHADTVTIAHGAYYVGGSIAEPGQPGTAMAVTKVLPSGAIDTAFGDRGRAAGPAEECGLTGEDVHATATHLYVTGTRGDCGASPVFVNRFTPQGALDPAFGTGGALVADAVAGNGVLNGRGIGVQAGGRLLIGFESNQEGSEVADAGVTRLLADLFACTIVGTPGIDVIIGTPGDDVICALAGPDIVHGGKGNDVILGGPGGDVILGGDGDDTIDAGAGVDTADGGPGADRCPGAEVALSCTS